MDRGSLRRSAGATGCTGSGGACGGPWKGMGHGAPYFPVAPLDVRTGAARACESPRRRGSEVTAAQWRYRFGMLEKKANRLLIRTHSARALVGPNSLFRGFGLCVLRQRRPCIDCFFTFAGSLATHLPEPSKRLLCLVTLQRFPLYHLVTQHFLD